MTNIVNEIKKFVELDNSNFKNIKIKFNKILFKGLANGK